MGGNACDITAHHANKTSNQNDEVTAIMELC